MFGLAAKLLADADDLADKVFVYLNFRLVLEFVLYFTDEGFRFAIDGVFTCG